MRGTFFFVFKQDFLPLSQLVPRVCPVHLSRTAFVARLDALDWNLIIRRSPDRRTETSAVWRRAVRYVFDKHESKSPVKILFRGRIKISPINSEGGPCSCSRFGG